MGPGLGARRGPKDGGIQRVIWTELQWGRAWEPGGAFTIRDDADKDDLMLQWGRAWEPGGAEEPEARARRRQGASMGPGLGARRGGPALGVRLHLDVASMGPGLGARRGVFGPAWTLAVGGLQWGRAWEPGGAARGRCRGWR